MSIGRDHFYDCTVKPLSYLRILQCHKANARFAAPNARTKVRMLPLFQQLLASSPPFRRRAASAEGRRKQEPQTRFPYQTPSPIMPCLCVYKIIMTCLPMCVGMQPFHMFPRSPWPPPLFGRGTQTRVPALHDSNSNRSISLSASIIVT